MTSDAERLLVSFCNTPGPGSPLLALVIVGGAVKVCLTAGEDATSSCGLTQDERYVYAACSRSGGASQILAIDNRTLELVERIPLPQLKDVHSVCIDGPNALIAVSTGTNEVMRLDLSRPEHPEVLWRLDQHATDTEHVNAVAWHGSHLLCSAFGRKTADRWYTARNGYVFDITGGARIWDGICHPHSLVPRGTALFVCESARSRLINQNGFSMQLDSYTRGLAFGRHGEIFVGSSIGRAQSALPEEVLNPADPGRRAGRCGINVTPRSGDGDFIDLSNHASEIYDILPLAVR